MTAPGGLYRVRAASACEIPRPGGEQPWPESPASAPQMHRQAVRQLPEAVATCASAACSAVGQELSGRVAVALGSRHGMRCVGELMSLVLKTGGRAKLDPLLFVYYSPQVVTAVVSQRLGLRGETCTFVGEAADLHALQAGIRLLFLGRSDLTIIGAWDFPDLVRSGGHETGPDSAIMDSGTSQIFLVDRPGVSQDAEGDVVGYTSKPHWIAYGDVTGPAIQSLVAEDWEIPAETIAAIYVQRSPTVLDSPVIKACKSLNGASLNVSSYAGLSSLASMKTQMKTAQDSRWLIISEQDSGGCMVVFNAGRKAFNE